MTLRFLFAFFVTFAMWTHAQAEKLQPTEDNFSSAMADIYLQKVIDRGGDNAFAHMRDYRPSTGTGSHVCRLQRADAPNAGGGELIASGHQKDEFVKKAKQ